MTLSSPPGAPPPARAPLGPQLALCWVHFAGSRTEDELTRLALSAGSRPPGNLCLCCLRRLGFQAPGPPRSGSRLWSRLWVRLGFLATAAWRWCVGWVEGAALSSRHVFLGLDGAHPPLPRLQLARDRLRGTSPAQAGLPACALQDTCDLSKGGSVGHIPARREQVGTSLNPGAGAGVGDPDSGSCVAGPGPQQPWRAAPLSGISARLLGVTAEGPQASGPGVARHRAHPARKARP